MDAFRRKATKSGLAWAVEGGGPGGGGGERQMPPRVHWKNEDVFSWATTAAACARHREGIMMM